MAEHLIRDEQTLREIIGDPIDMIAEFQTPDLEPEEIEFLQASPFLLLATVDENGGIQVSPKGDAPGFVVLEDSRTVLIPDRKGNKQIKGLTNILRTGQAGVVFLRPGTGETLRINGTAELTRDPEILERLSARGQPALLAIRVRARESFFHCAKALIRSKLWQPDTWGKRQKISFGKMFARKRNLDGNVADIVDKAIDEDYREVPAGGEKSPLEDRPQFTS